MSNSSHLKSWDFLRKNGIINHFTCILVEGVLTENPDIVWQFENTTYRFAPEGLSRSDSEADEKQLAAGMKAV